MKSQAGLALKKSYHRHLRYRCRTPPENVGGTKVKQIYPGIGIRKEGYKKLTSYTT